jgi:hypothetical protein
VELFSAAMALVEIDQLNLPTDQGCPPSLDIDIRHQKKLAAYSTLPSVTFMARVNKRRPGFRVSAVYGWLTARLSCFAAVLFPVWVHKKL